MKRPTDAEVDSWADGNPGQCVRNLWDEVRRARAEEERLRAIVDHTLLHVLNRRDQFAKGSVPWHQYESVRVWLEGFNG